MSKNISHVILLLLENRSFDHVLGSLKKTYPTLEGIDPAAPAKNNYQSVDYLQSADAARYLNFDPRHEYEHVMVQLNDRNNGFVQDFSQSYPQASLADRAEVMKYHDLGKLPALHALAQNFTICDHWFSSVPGPTWCNRLFALSGTSLGRVAMPEGIMNLNVHWYDQTTLFDRLNEQHISWKVYSGDAPLSLLFVHQWEPQNAVRYRPMTEFYRDVASFKKEGDPTDQDLPSFTFIEPSYWHPGANDAHPPHDILAADALVRNVYNAIRTNKDLWEQTLLVVAFDEHGGFFDHVTPPATVPPDYHQDEYTFDQLGVRVPVILVSPWVNNAVFSDTMDHTSLLKYLTRKWSLGPLGYRTQVAGTFDAAFVDNMRDVLPPIAGRLPGPAIGRPPQMESLNSHSRAMVALSHVLESMAEEDANIVAARTRQVLSGPQSQIDAAFDRFEGFLKVRGNR